MTSKKRDLAGPGISTYPEVERILPDNYESLLTRKETAHALYEAKRFIEDGLAKALNIQMVQVPMLVTKESGFNDMLDRDGSRTPVAFKAGLGLAEPMNVTVVQAATKWKRMALAEYGFGPGEGLNTDMRAVRKDYFVDHDHSCYVDQWDWERVMTREERNLDFLKDIVRKIYKVLRDAEALVQKLYPQLKDPRFPDLPEEITFIHAEEILEMYPDLPRKDRETKIVEKYKAVFILGIGWVLEDGYLTKCVRRITMTGPPKWRTTAGSSTASTEIFSCTTTSPSAATSSARWVFVLTRRGWLCR